MTASVTGGPSRAFKRHTREVKRGPPSDVAWGPPGSSDEEITSSSSGEEDEGPQGLTPKGLGASQAKRLRLDEKLLERVQKIKQQQREHQPQQQRLLLIGPEGAGMKEQQQKAQHLQQQQLLHSKLIALRVCTNSALRLSNRLPDGEVLQLLLQPQQQQQQKQTAASVEAVRKEAAETFALLRQLQQLLLQQSSIVAAYRASISDSTSPVPPAETNGGWQQRRDAYKQHQVQGGEGDVWDFVADRLFNSGLRSACLANADAWHQQTCAERTKNFSVFNQPISVQLNNTMLGEEEKLLSRSLRSSHILDTNKKTTSDSATQNHMNNAATKQTQKIEKCTIVGCTGSREIGKEIQHTHYDDTEFYVELLKTSIASGNAEMDSTELVKEKALLKSRSREKAKEVDRRASKGRKIRYKPIPQLQNFMAAEPWAPNTDALPGAGDPLVVESLMRNLFRGG